MSLGQNAKWKKVMSESPEFTFADIVMKVNRTNGKVKSLYLPCQPSKQVSAVPGLHNKLLKPLAQGASRFEKLLARKKSYWPEKITGLNFRNQRRGLHTKHD